MQTLNPPINKDAMSAPLKGQFQDHYVVLEIDPQADAATIQAAYTGLARKYGFESEEWDEAKLERVQRAFEVLSDPVQRREFDKIIGVAAVEASPKFSGAAFFEDLARQSALRSAILCVLYDRRRLNPFKPSIPMRILEGMIEAGEEQLNFALWYLKQRGWVTTDDKSSLQISADGMDYLEASRPTLDLVSPFLKRAPIADPPASAGAAESIRNLADRVERETVSPAPAHPR